jgi:hypothetical protein
MNRRSRARQVVDLVDLEIERKRNVVAYRLEVSMTEETGDITACPGEVVIDAQDLVASSQQSLTQVAAKKAGAARDKDTCRLERTSRHWFASLMEVERVALR